MYNIMIIDDEIEILNILKRYLSRNNNYSISTYSNPIEALEYIDNSIDLILLDIMMPQMNGLDLLEQVSKTMPNINILVMTAYSSLNKEQVIYKANKSYITKPFESMEYLEYKIEQVLK